MYLTSVNCILQTIIIILISLEKLQAACVTIRMSRGRCVLYVCVCCVREKEKVREKKEKEGEIECSKSTKTE